MKYLFALLIFLLSFPAAAEIPLGNYEITKIQCQSGKILQLGGSYMRYHVYLNFTDTKMTMTAQMKSLTSNKQALECVQINSGEYVYTQDNKFEGELENKSIKCNAKAWERILKKKAFGVEEYGEFTYSIRGDELIISNPNTITRYSCRNTGDYPIYHYKKIN